MRNIIALFIAILLFSQNSNAHANSLRFTAGAIGWADVVIVIDQTTNAQPSLSSQLLVMLPFGLSQDADIIAPDNIEASVISSQSNHSLMSVIHSSSQPFSIIIRKAKYFGGLVRDRRMKFEFDLGYGNFVTHKDILSRQTTISVYDVIVELPKEYSFDELSFQPSRDRWIGNGREWRLNYEPGNSKEIVYVAFPDPYENDTAIFVFIIVAVATFIAAIVGIASIAKYRSNLKILWLLTIVSGISIPVIIGLFIMTSDFGGTLVLIASALIPVLGVFLVSSTYLCKYPFSCRLIGSITGGESDTTKPRFARIKIYATDTGKLIKEFSAEKDGEYDHYVLIGYGERKIRAEISHSDYKVAKTGELVAHGGQTCSVPNIKLENAK